MSKTPRMTEDELRNLPLTVDLVTGGRAFGIGRTTSQRLARAGQFPVRVLRIGGQYRCITAEIRAKLGIESGEVA